MRRGVFLLAASSLLFATFLFMGRAIRPSIPAASSTSSGDTWAEKSSMAVPRDKHAAAEIGGKIYVVGGHSPERLSSVEEYDPATDTWSFRTPLAAPRSAFAGVALDGKMFVIGGDEVGSVATVQAYDPTTDSWSDRSPLMTPRSELAAAVVGGKIYAIGGYKRPPSGTPPEPLPVVEEYDPLADSWRARSPMPTARGDLAAAVLDDRIRRVSAYHLSATIPVTAADEALQGR